MLAAVASARCYLRWKSDVETASRREFRSYATFAALITYGISRCVVEALTAANFFDAQFGTFAFGVVASVPGAFFALTQTAMIGRWVRTVESIVMTLRYTRVKLGRVALLSSGILLIVFCVLLLVAVADTHVSFSPLSGGNWMEILNLLEGILYVFNGACFVALGAQLAFYWNTVSEPASTAARWRIAIIACMFSSLAVARGVLLCIGGAAQQSERLHVMLEYAVGPPAVLLAEWICLVLCFFVLQPTRASQQPVADCQFSTMENVAPLSTGSGGMNVAPETPRAKAWRNMSNADGTSPESPRTRYAPMMFGHSTLPSRDDPR